VNIINFVDQSTLVLFDIDHTLFRNKKILGRPSWLYQAMNQLKLSGVNKLERLQQLYPYWMRAQEVSEIEYIDEPGLRKLWDHLEKHRILKLGLTARQPCASALTVKQLNSLNLSFSDMLDSKFRFSVSKPFPSLYQDGVIFAHDMNNKGEIFKQFYLENKERLNKISKIVFIDDTQDHVNSVGAVCRTLDLDYVGIRYSADDRLKNIKLSNELIIKQLQILKHESNNIIARIKLESLSYQFGY